MINNKYDYFAFISYKREDEKWAKWLQDKLEHYKFPTNLNGRTDLPKNIRPTFRDVTDLNPGLLAEEINNALRNSEWLIVVCSPRSAKSPWVCKEAQTFIDLGRADHIIPFVIEGIPFSNDTATECYPEALLNLTGSKELLAANINEMGRNAAAIKVVARMFNLRFDALWQRYEREQKRNRNLLIFIAIVAFSCITGIAYWMYWQNQQTQRANWKMMENQARAVAEKSKIEISKGNVRDALLALLEVFPSENNMRPYVPEVDEAMQIVLYSLQHGGYNYQILGSNIGNVLCPRAGDVILTISEDGLVVVLDKNNYKRINSFRITNKSPEQLFDNETYLSVDNRTLMVVDSLSLQLYNIQKGRLEVSLPLDGIDKNKESKLLAEFIDETNTVKGHYFTSKIDNKCISYNAIKHIALFYYEIQQVDGTDEIMPFGYYVLVNISKNKELFRKYDYPAWEGPYKSPLQKVAFLKFGLTIMAIPGDSQQKALEGKRFVKIITSQPDASLRGPKRAKINL